MYVVDHAALYRMVGSADVMARQMSHLAAVAAMPNVTLQVLPALAHPATQSGFSYGLAEVKLLRSQRGQCVETATVAGAVLVRDTTDRDGATLAFTADAWAEFLVTLR